jgi:choline-sulfatase
VSVTGRISAAVVIAVGLIAGFGCGGRSAEEASRKPNIVLYVIDGAAAEFMSVYGYPRRTTRFLERLAEEGAIFENAYSNSSFTKTSVPSFMTSLQSSVLGGFRSESDPLPAQAVTMAERMHKAGYWTMVLTANPFCGRISGLDRGVDIMRDTGMAEARPTSADLHREFWRIREARPAEPYWVHFQPTDVHRPWEATSASRGAGDAPERLYRTARRLYEESMIFQDREIGKLVDRLKRRGEWDRTLFIVAADHSHVSAGLPFFDPEAPPWEAPVLASQKSRIPMIFVWPGRIPAGRRLPEAVSMIDLLPTVLELAGLPRSGTMQGRSFAPLLLGQKGWKPRPVVLDEFYAEGENLFGSIEIVDGRYGASLRIDPRPDDKKGNRERLRPAPLLIFDVQADPHALRSIHADRPDLAAKYSKMLGRLWRDNLALAREYTRAGKIPMTREETERLRSLGYIR